MRVYEEEELLISGTKSFFAFERRVTRKLTLNFCHLVKYNDDSNYNCGDNAAIGASKAN